MILLLSLLLISLLIIVHELGHFIAARICGVNVYEFSIGFGPTIFHFKTKRETMICLRSIPMGGYVRLVGLDMSKTSLDNPDISGRFQDQPLINRLFILAAGSLANLVVSFFILLMVYGMGGLSSTVTTTIQAVSKGSPAAHCSITAGDKILQINDEKVLDGSQLVGTIQASKGQPMHLLIVRGHQKMLLTVIPKRPNAQAPWQIGIKLTAEQHDRYHWGAALLRSINDTIQGIVLTCVGLEQLLTGKIGLSALSGPIGIVSVTGEMVNYGVLFLGRFLAFLGINLAVLNWLPLPALDGGRFLIEGFQAIIPFKIKETFLARVHLAGALALIILMVVITWLDITKLSVR